MADETLETGPADVETPSEATTDATIEAPAGAASETVPAEATPAEEPTVEQLIREFREATSPPPEPEAEPPAEAQPAEVPGDNGAQQQLAALQAQVEQANRAHADFEDLNFVMELAAERLGDAAVSEDFITRFLISEYSLNPDLARAWDDRLSSKDALARCNKAIDRAITKLADSVQSMPDREATEDRNAVVAAVRGASAAPPAEKEPDVSRMTNEEFARYQERFGYRTI